MNNELTVYTNVALGSVRTILRNGEPWFVAKDVCDCLLISNPTMAMQRLEDDERAKLNLGRQGSTNIINESGLYSLVLASRKPSAKAFKHWITHEVIPSIRKSGVYMTPQQARNFFYNPDHILQIVENWKVDRDKRIALEAKVAQDAPKVVLADCITASVSTISIGSLAKFLNQNGIDTGRNRLMEWLRQHGYIMKQGDRNLPTQRSINLGLFEITEQPYYVSGQQRSSLAARVTGRGQQYFLNLFKRKSA